MGLRAAIASVHGANERAAEVVALVKSPGAALAAALRADSSLSHMHLDLTHARYATLRLRLLVL